MNQSEAIDQAILALATERGSDKTICPSEVARHIGGQDKNDWRPLMSLIRERAENLARGGSIDIKKGGETVNLNDFFGIYRIAISK